MNLNYESGFVSYDPLTGKVVTNEGAKELSAQDYTASGFDAAISAITVYNVKMVNAIRSGAIDSASATDINGYSAVIGDIYDIIYDGEGNLVTTLKNYEHAISEAESSDLENEDVIAEYNATLSSYYDAIVAALTQLKSKYDLLDGIASAESVGEFTLPTLPEKYVVASSAA